MAGKFEQRDNSGSLFVNDRKQTDNHPDRSGKAMIDGKMYWVNGWIKKSDNGQWLSLAFKLMEEHGQENQARRQPQQNKPTNKAKQTAPPQDDGDPDNVPF